MTPTQLVLASVALGIAIGALATWTVLAASAAGRRRADAMRPELPTAAVEILHPLEHFAVILDSSLSIVYANPAARDDPRINGEQLSDPDFLQRARSVMASGVTDTRMPNPDDIADTIRIQIVRMQRRFLVVFVDDLGEEQRVNAMRRDFIANVSHELKTPIAAISLLSDAVLEAASEPEIVRDFAKKLSKQTRRLGDLSRDIIQLSEAQTTIRAQDREPVSLRAVVRSEVEAHQELAVQRGVSLVLTEIPDETAEPFTPGRPGPIAVVIDNLLSNAIFHSPEGATVGIGIETHTETCTVTVTDQGEGIAPEHLPRIFERFYRVDTARSREGGGTGLGLSIARHTMRGHGGDINVWSQLGVGSSFTLTFPLTDPGASRKKKGKRKKAKKPKAAKQVQAKVNEDQIDTPSQEKVDDA